MLTLRIYGAPLPELVARMGCYCYIFVFYVEVSEEPVCLRLSVCCSLIAIGFELSPLASAPDFAEDPAAPSPTPSVYALIISGCIYIPADPMIGV